MNKLEEYLKDLENQHAVALKQVYMIEGAMQVIRQLIEDEKKATEDVQEVP
jgi:hypothetical protein